jgi:hypothetical protein
VSVVWAIGFLLAAALLWLGQRDRASLERHYLWTFGVAGMLTAYVDLLSNPLVTLAIPLLVLHWKGDWPGAQRSRPAWTTVLLIVAAWAAGYFGSWSAKWWLASLAGEQSVAARIVEAIGVRLSGPVGHNADVAVTAWSTIQKNLAYWTTGLIALLLALVAALVRNVRRPDRLAPRALDAARASAFLCIFLLPFGWMALARNHSTTHAWFVAAILYPSFALAMGEAWKIIRKPATAG